MANTPKSPQTATAGKDSSKPAKRKLGAEQGVSKPDKTKKIKPDQKPNEGKFMKTGKKPDPTKPKSAKPKSLTQGKFGNKGNAGGSVPEKIEDWNKFKKEKKELRINRIKKRTKDNFDRIQEAKKMGEKLRLKLLNDEERTKVINQLHGLLKGCYAKFVVAHDTARIVQWLLKYSSKIVVHQISQELIPVVITMLQSKYGTYCVKRLLKYGEDDIRSSVIDQFKGHVVKLVSHTVSAPVVEFAFSTYAKPEQKQLLVQEFYGDLFKNSKDPTVKHIRDAYKDNESMKAATLGACKSNIKKIIAKGLLDSGLVQTVLSQYLEECSESDKAELVSDLASHIVIISNSRDGSKAAMQCIWHGTAKDKKVIMKSLKENLIELSKHEFGHHTVICLLDSVDDTVLLHKVILAELLKNAKDLAVDEYGRKVLLWLVAPADSTVYHPQFIQQLTSGREASNSKKPSETRRAEILQYSINTLLNLIIEDCQFWLSSGSLGIEMLAILKAGSGDVLKEALGKVAELITEEDWIITEGEKEAYGVEHAGLHIVLKKLIQHDKVATEQGKPSFSSVLVQHLNNDLLKKWIDINRGCFLLVAAWENCGDAKVQKTLQEKLKPHIKLLASQSSTGAKILMKKLT